MMIVIPLLAGHTLGGRFAAVAAMTGADTCPSGGHETESDGTQANSNASELHVERRPLIRPVVGGQVVRVSVGQEDRMRFSRCERIIVLVT